MIPTIEILPTNQASWIQTELPWAYRITPANKENAIIGAMKGTREDVMEKAKKIRDKMIKKSRVHPFTISVKSRFNREGL